MSYKIPHLMMIGTTVPVGTSFFPAANTTMGFTAITVESHAQVRMTHAGKISNLKLWVNRTGFGGATLMLRVNGADTALSLTTSNAIAINQNITDEVYVQVGDLVNFRLQSIVTANNRFISFTFDFEADGDRSIQYIANMRRQTQSLAASTRIEPLGDIDNFGLLAESAVQGALRHKCRLLNWHANVELNTRNSATTAVFRQNGTDAATITVPAATTGRFNLDTSIDLEFDDLINTNINLSAGTGSIRFFMIQATLESANPRELTVWGGRFGAQTSTQYVAVTPGISNAAANRSYTVHVTKPMVVDLHKFNMVTNTQTAPFNVSVGTSSNNALAFTVVICFSTTVPASTTGWFENNTDSYTLANNQFLYYLFNYNSGTYTLGVISARLTMPAEIVVFQTTNHAI